jgi:hypothetical protein
MDKAYEDYFESLSEGEEALSFSEFTQRFQVSRQTAPLLKCNGNPALSWW